MRELREQPPSEDSVVPPGEGEDPKPKTQTDAQDELYKALREVRDGEQPGDEPPADAPPEGEDPQSDGKLDTLDAVAAKLGVEVSDLYEIEIPQPGSGEDRTTIGQLADFAKDRGQFEIDRLQFEETRTKGEADLLRANEELRALVAMLPAQVKDERLLNAVAGKMAAEREEQRTLTLRNIPEWQDERVEADERKALAEHLSQYGFSPTYLDNVGDHKTLKYIRDNWRREQALDRVLAQLKKRKTSGQRSSRSDGKPARKPRAERRASRSQSVGQQVHQPVSGGAKLTQLVRVHGLRPPARVSGLRASSR